MNFSKDTYSSQKGSRFITFTEAAEILGSGTHTRIRNLVLAGKIVAYKIPEVSKLRVQESEIIRLIQKASNTTVNHD